MKDRPKRSSSSANNSYTEPKLDDREDPISSDDQFADPMYDHEGFNNDSASSESSQAHKKKNKKNRMKTYFIRKCDMEKAIEEIRNKRKPRRRILHLNHKKMLKVRDLCSRDPKLRSRNGFLTRTQQILYQLNRSVLKHDWASVATMIDYMLNLNGKLLPVIWKSLFLVLFNHPNSSTEKIDTFLQMCLGLRTDYERGKYLEEIFTLPDASENLPGTSGTNEKNDAQDS